MQQKIVRWIGTYLNLMAPVAPGHTGKLGYKLFGRPIRKKITPEEMQLLNRAEPLHLEYNNIKIRGYRWGGGSKKILLLHGWQSHSARWKNVIPHLTECGCSVIAIDAPGHGQSGGNFFSAPLYGEVIMKLGEEVGRFHAIAGHSMGAFSTLYAQSQYKKPEADRLVIMATPGEVEDFVTYFRQRLGLNEQSLQTIRDYFQNDVGRTVEEFSITRLAENLDLPGLIIHDKQDRFAPFKYAEQLNQRWDNATLMATEGLGHHLASKKVVEAMAEFIDGKPGCN